MQVWIWILLFKIYVLTYAQELKINDKERSVNLALETVLEFNHRDNSADIQFLDNVQRFITKVRGVIDRNKVSRRDFKTSKNATFTDFIQDVVSILNTYDQPDFQDVFDIIDDEIRKYHYRGCKFYELTENFEIRKLMASKLEVIRGQPIIQVRDIINKLAKALKEEKYDDSVKELVDYINSLYRHDSTDKFNRVLTNLQGFNKSKTKKSIDDLVKIVRDALRSVVFDHYTELNPNARRELKHKIETFLKLNKLSNPKSYTNKEPVKIEKRQENANIDTIQAKKIEPNTLRIITTKDDTNTNNNSEREEVVDEQDEDLGELAESDGRQERVNIDKEKERPKEKEKPKEKPKEKDRERPKEKDRERPKEKEIEIEKDVPKEKDKTNDIELELASEVLSSNNEGETDSEYYKELSHMRDGVKEVRGSLEKNKAVPRYTRLDANLVDPREDFEPMAMAKKVPRSHYKTTKRHYWTGRTFSSDDKISEDVGTVEDNSLEFHAEELTTTKHRSATNEVKRYITLWEETATGGIPQYMLNRYSTKKHSRKHHKMNRMEHKKHKTKRHNKHDKRDKRDKYNKYKKKKHDRYANYNSDSYHKNTLRTKHKKKKSHVMMSEHNADFAVRSTAMEFYEYKKMLEPVNVARMPMERFVWPDGWIQVPSPRGALKKPEKSRLNTTTRPTSRVTTAPTKKMTRRVTITPAAQRYAKRYEVLPLASLRNFRKFGPPAETKSMENYNRKEKKTTRKSFNDNSTVVVDANVIKRLKDLEREIKEVKNKIVDQGTEKKTKVREKEKKNDLKDKRRSRPIKNTSREDKKTKHKRYPDQDLEYKTEIKINAEPLETTARTTEKILTTTKEYRTPDNPIIVVNLAESTIKVNKEIGREGHNDEPHEEGTMRFANQENKPIHNYDEVDEWKDAFKINSKNVGLKTTTKSTTITTTTTTTSTTTTPKPTETVPPTTTKVEIFIPLPSSKPTTVKTSTTQKTEPPQDIHLPIEATPYRIKSLNSMSPMHVSPFAESNVFNYSDSLNKRESLHNEVSYILKKNNISVPTDKPELYVTNLKDGSLPYSKLRKNIDFTPAPDVFNFGNNTIASGLLFTDPFRDIEEELEFLKG